MDYYDHLQMYKKNASFFFLEDGRFFLGSMLTMLHPCCPKILSLDNSTSAVA